MKFNILGFTIVQLALIACTPADLPDEKTLSPREKLISNTQWQYEIVYNINDEYRGQYTCLENDSLTIQLVDSATGQLIPEQITWVVNIADPLLILTYFRGDTSKFKMPDSVQYKILKLAGRNVLLLKNNLLIGDPYSQNIQLPDSLYDQIVEFKISGYAIGDFIDRTLVDITDIQNSHIPPREIATLKSSPDVELSLIRDSLVIEISRKDIPNSEIDDVIEVITAKTGMEPEYDPPELRSYDNFVAVYESYIWRGGLDFYVTLNRLETSWDKSSTKYQRLLGEKISVITNWELDISSDLQSLVLEQIYFNQPESHKKKSKFVE